MERYNYIIATLLSAIIFVGCENTTEAPIPPVVEESDNYIDFDVDMTRAAIIEELPDYIGIYGYQYQKTNSWGVYKVDATPNVFDTAPQVAKNESGFYNYSPAKQWTGNKYTFFAYAPYNNESVVPSDKDVANSPYVDYTISRTDHSKLADVITAAHYIATAASNTIVFEMKHRLALVDIGILNTYEYNYTTTVDGQEVTTSEQITIEITDLAVSFENLYYDKERIYLDDENMTDSKTKGASTAAAYDLVTSGSLSFAYNSTNKLQYMEDTALFFIPQTETDLRVSAVITFKKKRPDGTYLSENGSDVFTTTKELKFNAPLQETIRHDVVLSFTSAAVSINLATSAAWEKKPIEYEFE